MGLVTATVYTVLTLPGMRMLIVLTASLGLPAPAKVNIRMMLPG